MPEALTAADFEQRVSKLSERLESLRQAARLHHGSPLPYAGLDLSAELPELVTILGALVNQDPDEPVAKNARIEVGGRRLALAAVMALLQSGEGIADFNARYTEHVGTEPSLVLYEKLLPTAMREAGLSLPAKAEPKRLLAAVLAASGLPASLLSATIRYFVAYWKYFHPQSQVLAPLANLECFTLPEAVRAELSELAGRLLPNAVVVETTLEGLATVFGYLRTQSKWRVGDLFEKAQEIEYGSGVNPKTLLRNNEEVFAHLQSELGHAWTPEQFRHVMMTRPRGSEIRLPSGSLAMVDKVLNVPQWGLYRFDGKPYLVLPNEGFTVDELKTWPQRQLTAAGNRAFWRGNDEAAVLVDMWPQPLTPKPLHEERELLGYFHFQILPPARTLQVGAQALPPHRGVHGRSGLLLTESEAGFTLNVRVAALRVALPELAGETLQLECPQAETAGRLSFVLDDRGVGGLPDTLLALGEPAPGTIEALLQRHETGSVVDGSLTGPTLSAALPEIMLFAEATGALLAPSAAPYPYGLPSYILLSARPINTDTIAMMEIGVDELTTLGSYNVYRLRWNRYEQPFSLFLDAQHQWAFHYPVETVWQAGELPPPPPPLAFEAVSPVGLTVATVDDLYVDDVSYVEDALVIVKRDGETLAAHSWAELNWMMNFPGENRRFSGGMLRRACFAQPEDDLAGRYALSLVAGGTLLGERLLTVLPPLELIVRPTGPQVEGVSYTLKADGNRPCFEGGATALSVPLGKPVIDGEVMESSPFAPKPLEATLQLRVPFYDVPIAVTADVMGYRLLDDNEGVWVRKTHLDYEALAHHTLVAFGTHAKLAKLTIGEHEREEEFYEGFATFSLADVQELLTETETPLRLSVDGTEVGALSVTWHTHVSHFEAANDYLVDYNAVLELQAEGPAQVPVRLEAYAPDGRRLGELAVTPEGGTLQTVHFHLPPSRDYPVVVVKAFSATSGTNAAGSVEVRNASYEPEIEAINRKIAADQYSAALRHERAQLLLARGLRKAAARDLQAAVELGMTELADSPQYQQFMSQRRAERFHEDIKALASFFVPFARKELNLG